MEVAEDDFLTGVGDVGIDLGGGEGAVTEDGLDVLDVNAFFQQEGCQGMAEGVGCHAFVDAGFPCKLFDTGSDGLGIEWFSPQVEEEGACAFCSVAGREAEVVFQCSDDGWLADLDDALSAAFAIDFDEAFLQVNVADVQGAEFGDAQARAKQQFDDGDEAQELFAFPFVVCRVALIVQVGKDLADF